jgi:hypothetical protein
MISIAGGKDPDVKSRRAWRCTPNDGSSRCFLATRQVSHCADQRRRVHGL